MGMNVTDIASIRRGVPGGPAMNYPTPGATVSQQISNPTNAGMGNIGNASSDAGVAPAFSWLALVATAVLIRVLWERGGRPGGPIIPGTG